MEQGQVERSPERNRTAAEPQQHDRRVCGRPAGQRQQRRPRQRIDCLVGGSFELLERGDDRRAQPGTGADGSAAPGAYVNWNAGPNPEPNGRGASDCLRLRADGGWADIECDTEFAALCEGPPL
jgi:hypothetical protein